MKKVLLAALAVIALASSCSKENENATPEQGQKATLNVTVDAPVLSRAVAASVPADVVGNFSVFITDNTGEIQWSAYSATGAALTGPDAVTVTTTAQNVYIVANAGDLTSSISTMAALNAYLADLNGTGSQASAANRWATGQSASLNFVQSGNDFVATTTVTLQFIAARITVTVDNQMTNYGAPGSLTLDNIAVLNARGESLLFGTSLIPTTYSAGKKFYTGYDEPTPGDFAPYWPAAGDYTVASSILFDALNINTSTGVVSDVYYYYVFENDALTAADMPTIVTLIGDDNGNPVSWPVHLAPYEQWEAGSGTVSSIERGKSYNINIKLTGDAANGGGGVWPPVNPVINSKVEITVSLTDWVPVTLEKEF